MLRNTGIILLLLMATSFGPKSQLLAPLSEQTASVVLYDENIIQNGQALNNFYNQIDLYIANHKDRIVITHIGDSHIQADYLTQETRILFQKTFGNAGRGYIFPYRMIRSNGPVNLGTQYGGTWESCRSVLLSNDCNFGICGITATTFDSAAYFRIDPNSYVDMNYEFDRVKLFHYQSPHSFDIALRKSDSSVLDYDIQPRGETVSEIYFAEMQDSLWFTFNNQGPQKYFQFFGMSLENGRRGVLYNAIGQNGAFVKSYLRNTYFEEEMKALESDMVVVSLGTNDGYMSEGMFCKACFTENYRELLNRIRRANPDVTILLTTPGDFYIRQRNHNSNIEKMNEAIYELAREFKAGVWDFNKVMGGDYSIKKWKSNGLAQNDLVHFTETGYQLQGRLLYEAIMNGFEKRFD
ncbi:MAG: hypothetical protein GC181_07780 [Bacteroidetes bacterium]|nr:hypothetical protein [Bacteroidota bacterium]